MRKYIFPDRIANQIRQRRSLYAGTFLIVEGGSDKRVYESFADTNNCEFSIANSKDNAINALGILENDGFPGVLAIVDADFDILLAQYRSSSNLFLTDSHDLETMILRSAALDRFLNEFTSEEKCKDKDVRRIILNSGKHIGYLRLANSVHSLFLNFEYISPEKFDRFGDKRTLVIDVSKLSRFLISNSEGSRFRDQDIQGMMESLKQESHDLWQVCCGHDLICLLAVGMRYLFATYDSKELSADSIERTLRLTYQGVFDYFSQTQLYKSIKAWEASNQPFKVLSG